MFHHLEGELVLLRPTRAAVDVAGVGYECRIPLSTFSALKGKEGTRVRILTHLQVLEDDLRLYGFATEKERELFRLITSISGVGPAIAFAAMASFDPSGFAGAIAAGDSRALQKIKGVGPKLSERIVLELKDRSDVLSLLAEGGPGIRDEAIQRAAIPDRVLNDAVAALMELGFSQKEARGRIDGALAKLLPGGPGSPTGKPISGSAVTVEGLIQAALRTRS